MTLQNITIDTESISNRDQDYLADMLFDYITEHYGEVESYAYSIEVSFELVENEDE